MYKTRRHTIRQLIKSLRDGNQLVVTCTMIKVSPQTIWNWSHKPVKFSNFYHTRLAVLLARSQELSEVKRNAIVETSFFKKLRDGTASATEYIFYFCNRDPARWKNVKDAVISVQASSHLHLDNNRAKALGEMKDTELDAVLDGIINRRRTSVSSGID